MRKIYFRAGSATDRWIYYNGTMHSTRSTSEFPVVDKDRYGRIVALDTRGRRSFFHRSPKLPYLDELRTRVRPRRLRRKGSNTPMFRFNK